METLSTVTGFDLFVLCHYFGRRGRAMARSLAWQTDCPVPLHLCVFYSRPEDARMVKQGALDGPSPPRLELIAVPPESIMQRALHFSKVRLLRAHSHTVFFDSDLWFPPAFWRSYSKAIDSETSGYWSCRVMDVPLPVSESFVDDWTRVTESDLEQVTTGRRMDGQAGRAGHFQCIPGDLAEYPPDPIKAVIHADLAFSKVAIAKSVDQRTDRRISRVPAFHFEHPHCWEGTGGLQL